MIVPAKQLLSKSSAEGYVYTQVIPNNYVIGNLDETMQQMLKDIESKLENIAKDSTSQESAVDQKGLEELKKEFEDFRAILEAGNFSFLMKHDKQHEEFVTPTHHKLKFRRMSNEAQKLVGEKFREIWDTTLSDECIESLRQTSFDCFAVGPEDMLYLLQHMYLEFDLPRKFGFSVETLRNFLYQVYKNYNDVPFHNFRHGFCVTQIMYAMLVRANLREKLGDLNILVLLTASICHDLDHPGSNNFFQIHSRTELAQRYNDVSILENHHCSTAFRILDLDDCNIFGALSTEQYRSARDAMIGCILATDMACHNRIFGYFVDLLKVGVAYDKPEHVHLVMQILIKVADISNEARPLHIADPWLDLLFVEFFSQSDEEKRLGLPVTSFMDRDKVTKPSSQVCFLGVTLLPLFEAVGKLYKPLVGLVVQPVRDAFEYYSKLNDIQNAQRSSIAPADPDDSDPSTSAAATSDKNTKRRKSDDPSKHTIVFFAGLDSALIAILNEANVSESLLKFLWSSNSLVMMSNPCSRRGSHEISRNNRNYRHSDAGTSCGNFRTDRKLFGENASRSLDGGRKLRNSNSVDDQRSATAMFGSVRDGGECSQSSDHGTLTENHEIIHGIRADIMAKLTKEVMQKLNKLIEAGTIRRVYPRRVEDLTLKQDPEPSHGNEPEITGDANPETPRDITPQDMMKDSSQCVRSESTQDIIGETQGVSQEPKSDIAPESIPDNQHIKLESIRDKVLESVPDTTPELSGDVAADSTENSVAETNANGETTEKATRDVAVFLADIVQEWARDFVPRLSQDLSQGLTLDSTQGNQLEVTQDTTLESAREDIPKSTRDSGSEMSREIGPQSAVVGQERAKNKRENDPGLARDNNGAESAQDTITGTGVQTRGKQKKSPANGNKVQRSSSRSPDFRRMMNRMRGFGGRDKSVGSAGKTEETAAADDEPGPSSRPPRPPGWMCGFLQNIRKKSPLSSAKGNHAKDNENQKKEPEGKN